MSESYWSRYRAFLICRATEREIEAQHKTKFGPYWVVLGASTPNRPQLVYRIKSWIRGKRVRKRYFRESSPYTQATFSFGLSAQACLPPRVGAMAPRRWVAESKSTAVEIRQKANSIVAVERLHPFQYRSVYELKAVCLMRPITEQAQAREDYLAWRKESENFRAGVADGERRRRRKLYHFPIPVWRWGTKRKLRADVHVPMPVPADYIELGLRIIKIPDGLKISPAVRALCARVLAKGRKRGRPSTRQILHLQCEFCHRPFETKRGEQRFCTREHYLEFCKNIRSKATTPHGREQPNVADPCPGLSALGTPLTDKETHTMSDIVEMKPYRERRVLRDLRSKPPAYVWVPIEALVQISKLADEILRGEHEPPVKDS